MYFGKRGSFSGKLRFSVFQFFNKSFDISLGFSIVMRTKLL